MIKPASYARDRKSRGEESELWYQSADLIWRERRTYSILEIESASCKQERARDSFKIQIYFRFATEIPTHMDSLPCNN